MEIYLVKIPVPDLFGGVELTYMELLYKELPTIPLLKDTIQSLIDSYKPQYSHWEEALQFLNTIDENNTGIVYPNVKASMYIIKKPVY